MAYYAKQRPGQLSFASPARASVGHLTWRFSSARRIEMDAVLYKAAARDGRHGRGHVPCYFGNLHELIPHAGSGRTGCSPFRASGARTAAAVPTVAGQGYPGFRTLTWNGYVAPGATPRDIVERIAREIAAGCKDATFVERLNKIGVDAVCSTPAEFAQAVREDLVTWKEAVQAAK